MPINPLTSASYASLIIAISGCGHRPPPATTPESCSQISPIEISHSLFYGRREDVILRDPILSDIRRGQPALGEVLIQAEPALAALRYRLQFGEASPNNLYYLFGPAGIGKTPIMSQLRLAPGVAFIDLSRKAEQQRQYRDSTRADLVIGQDTLSRLPVISLPNTANALLHLVPRNARDPEPQSILIDGLDEIDPTSIALILQAARDFAKSHPHMTIVVAGRGEVFRRDLIRNDARGIKLIRIPAIPITDSAVVRWYLRDLVKMGGNDSLKATLGKLTPEMIQEALDRQPELQTFMYSGLYGNYVLKRIAENRKLDIPTSSLVSDLMSRNQTTHSRPSASGSNFSEMYLDALRQVARRYKPDTVSGYFEVPTGAVVCVQTPRGTATVDVESVLALSGLVDVDPIDNAGFRVRFWPASVYTYFAGR